MSLMGCTSGLPASYVFLHLNSVTESSTSGYQEGEGRRSCKGKIAFSSLLGRHLEISVSVLGFVWEMVISASVI